MFGGVLQASDVQKGTSRPASGLVMTCHALESGGQPGQAWFASLGG